MAERNQETNSSESVDDIFEPGLSDIDDDDMVDFMPVSTDKQRLAEKRRRAEKRLEEKRLREELGYYDLEFDDF